jgi:hypothetical protein
MCYFQNCERINFWLSETEREREKERERERERERTSRRSGKMPRIIPEE